MALAEIQRKLQLGTKIQLVHHDWVKLENKPKISGIRQVDRVQTNGVRFTGGSWLMFPPASHIRETETGFELALNPDWSEKMVYEWR